MATLDTYDYTVLRVVPRVEREEFINVGVLVSCQARQFLRAAVLLDEVRLCAFAPQLALPVVRAHLEAICRICAGGEGSGPIGALPQRARFHWLTARRSSVLQTSAVHSGRCADLPETLERLLDRMVRVTA